MKKTTEVSNFSNLDKASYVCSTTEFTQTTDAEDGSMLEVVDESTHTVVKYCLAYNGYWNER